MAQRNNSYFDHICSKIIVFPRWSAFFFLTLSISTGKAAEAFSINKGFLSYAGYP